MTDRKITDRKITGLMACDPDGVIGNKGALPWSYPEDLSHFQRTTHGQVMIMGQKTFESTPAELLKNRFNIVFSHDKNSTYFAENNTVFVSGLKDFSQLTNMPLKEIYMIGGAQIATLFLAHGLLSEFLLTHIHKKYEGDTHFPLHLLKNWPRVPLTYEKGFTIYKYSREQAS